MYIHPQTLPPTSAAAKYNSLRVYFQIQEWKAYGGELKPLEWGWKKSEGKLMPVLIDMPPALDDLLKIIRCNCHTDCSSMRCTCKKHNVKCSVACGNCRGQAVLTQTGWKRTMIIQIKIRNNTFMYNTMFKQLLALS